MSFEPILQSKPFVLSLSKDRFFLRALGAKLKQERSFDRLRTSG